jgi:hypothetical protein
MMGIMRALPGKRSHGSKTRMTALSAWLLALAVFGFGQVVENPAKPLAKDAGRVIALSEVWRITDDSGEFFFKYPHDIQVAEDGSLFLADADQFLRFSPEGKFLGNLYKKGQGPGEIGREFTYHPRGRDLFVQDMNSQRFWRTDLDGVFKEQIGLANKDYHGFAGVLPKGFLFLKTVWPPFNERTGKLMEILETVVLVGSDGSERREVASFRPKTYLAPDAGMSWDPDILELSPDRKHLYAVHSRDYVVEVIDLGSGKPVRSIKRAYPKVAHAEADWEPDFRKRTGAPKIEFEADIQALYAVGNGLWVATSTDDKAKGRLIDVFDQDGRFIDSFYLGAGRALMAVRDDALYCREKNEDETISIAKYRIVR